MKFEGGGRYDAPVGKCELGRGITRRLFMRPACHHCPYASADRPGDLTLGDFGTGGFTAEEKKNGVSMLLINTAKGAQTFDVLPLEREHRTLEEAVSCCRALPCVSRLSLSAASSLALRESAAAAPESILSTCTQAWL